MEKTRFSQFTASELNLLLKNLTDIFNNDRNFIKLVDELKREIELKAESKYRHELNNINESIKELKKQKHDLELYLKIYGTKQTDL